MLGDIISCAADRDHDFENYSNHDLSIAREPRQNMYAQFSRCVQIQIAQSYKQIVKNECVPHSRRNVALHLTCVLFGVFIYMYEFNDGVNDAL